MAHERAVVGKETVIYRGGKKVERRVPPDCLILALLIKNGDIGEDGQRVGNRTGESFTPEVITAARKFVEVR